MDDRMMGMIALATIMGFTVLNLIAAGGKTKRLSQVIKEELKEEKSKKDKFFIEETIKEYKSKYITGIDPCHTELPHPRSNKGFPSYGCTQCAGSIKNGICEYCKTEQR